MKNAYQCYRLHKGREVPPAFTDEETEVCFDVLPGFSVVYDLNLPSLVKG